MDSSSEAMATSRCYHASTHASPRTPRAQVESAATRTKDNHNVGTAHPQFYRTNDLPEKGREPSSSEIEAEYFTTYTIYNFFVSSQ